MADDTTRGNGHNTVSQELQTSKKLFHLRVMQQQNKSLREAKACLISITLGKSSASSRRLARRDVWRSAPLSYEADETSLLLLLDSYFFLVILSFSPSFLKDEQILPRRLFILLNS